MNLLKVITILFVFLLAISPFFILPRVITIRNVTCSSQFGPCREELQDGLRNVAGNKLRSTRQAINRLLSESVFIKQFSVSYKFPDILDVEVLENKPFFALENKNGDISIIDGRGFCLSFGSTTNLPVVVIDGELPKLGERVSETQLFSLNIAYDMFFSYSVKSVSLEKDSLIVDLPIGYKVTFPVEGDKETLLGALSLILSRLNNEDKATRIEGVNDVTEIDLRFKNPILR